MHRRPAAQGTDRHQKHQISSDAALESAAIHATALTGTPHPGLAHATSLETEAAGQEKGGDLQTRKEHTRERKIGEAENPGRVKQGSCPRSLGSAWTGVYVKCGWDVVGFKHMATPQSLIVEVDKDGPVRDRHDITRANFVRSGEQQQGQLST